MLSSILHWRKPTPGRCACTILARLIRLDPLRPCNPVSVATCPFHATALPCPHNAHQSTHRFGRRLPSPQLLRQLIPRRRRDSRPAAIGAAGGLCRQLLCFDGGGHSGLALL